MCCALRFMIDEERRLLFDIIYLYIGGSRPTINPVFMKMAVFFAPGLLMIHPTLLPHCLRAFLELSSTIYSFSCCRNLHFRSVCLTVRLSCLQSHLPSSIPGIGRGISLVSQYLTETPAFFLQSLDTQSRFLFLFHEVSREFSRRISPSRLDLKSRYWWATLWSRTYSLCLEKPSSFATNVRVWRRGRPDNSF